MRLNTLQRLCCPFCAGDLRVRRVVREAADGAILFGTVACQGCTADYPIVARVLLLGTSSDRLAIHAETTEGAIRQGPTFSELCGLLERGEYERALALTLMPSGPDPDLLFRRPRQRVRRQAPLLAKPVVPLRVQRLVNRYARQQLSPLAQRRLARILLAGLESLTAADAIALCYGAFSRSELSNYFTFRFGQPRHLAALSVASVITRAQGPLLDLACGAGHLTHYLCASGHPVIGVDRDYLRLFLAANFVARAGDYVCAWADRSLPFPAASFVGALCSDAFHYFVSKSGCVRELLRVVSDQGIIAIARAGNAAVEPHEGYELTPAGYARLCAGLPHCLYGEDELMRAYLSRTQLGVRAPGHAEPTDKWISMLIAKSSECLPTHGSVAAWPHALGRLGVNPIYEAAGVDRAGNLELVFRFPSTHYAAEDAAYTQYAPSRATVPRRVLEGLDRGELDPSDPELERLIGSFVLIGMPDRYSSDPLLLESVRA